MALRRIRHRHFTRCAFCPRKADSKEHAWEDWALDRLRTKDSGIIGHLEGGEIYEPSQKAVRIKCLCDRCNGGWLKNLVDAAKPMVASMIADLSISLDIPQQWVLSAWATSRAMVWEHIAREPRPLFYSDTHRVGLRATRTVPPNTWVWIARYGGTAQTGAWASDYTIPERMHVTSLIYGRLLVQILSVRTNASTQPGTVINPKPGPWPLNTVRIWPSQRIARWPPHLTVDDASLEDFVGRWDRHGPNDMIHLS